MSRALLIIDVEESFRQRPIWRTVSDPKIADHLLPVVQAARAAGDEIIWVLHSEPGTGSTFDSGAMRNAKCQPLMSRAGLPATLAPTGTSCVTTLPAPITESSPMVVPGSRSIKRRTCRLTQLTEKRLIARPAVAAALAGLLPGLAASIRRRWTLPVTSVTRDTLKIGDSVTVGTPPTNGGWSPHVHFQILLDLDLPTGVTLTNTLPANADYVVGNFRGAPLKEFVPLIFLNAPSLAIPLPLSVKASAPTAMPPCICSAAPLLTVVPAAVVPSAVAF